MVWEKQYEGRTCLFPFPSSIFCACIDPWVCSVGWKYQFLQWWSEIIFWIIHLRNLDITGKTTSYCIFRVILENHLSKSLLVIVLPQSVKTCFRWIPANPEHWNMKCKFQWKWKKMGGTINVPAFLELHSLCQPHEIKLV